MEFRQLLIGLDNGLTELDHSDFQRINWIGLFGIGWIVFRQDMGEIDMVSIVSSVKLIPERWRCNR